MTTDIHALLDHLWQDYTRLNPQAQRIHALLAVRGDGVVNDHISLRTFDHPKLGIDTSARIFESFGYTAANEYDFPAKRVRARHYEPPEPDLPKVFISELCLGEFSHGVRDIVGSLTRQVAPDSLSDVDYVIGGTLWNPMMHDAYDRLRQESEYAAWVSAFGFRANHFTVLVNALSSFDTLAELNDFLREHGFPLNESGGSIKGSPEILLEQSATLAPPVSMQFADGTADIPGCYYEFVQRHPMADGGLFQGFVASSTDRIFESTDHLPTERA